MQSLLLVLHIIGVSAWLGTSIAQFAGRSRFDAAGGQTAATWWDTTVRFGQVVYTPAGVLVLLTGVGLVLSSDGGYSFSDMFVSVGFLVIIAGIVLGVAVFGPKGRLAAESYRQGDASAARAQVALISRFGVLDTLLVLVAIVAMVMKWGV